MSTSKKFDMAVENDSVLPALLALSEAGDINLMCHSYPSLVYALNENAPNVSIALIGAGADVNMSGACRNTPQHVGVLGKRLDIVEMLVEKGANVNPTNKEGMTPLHFAAEHEDPKIARYLFDHGANVLARDNKGRLPLYFAGRSGNAKMVQFLLSVGPEVSGGQYNKYDLYPESHWQPDVIDLLKLWSNKV